MGRRKRYELEYAEEVLGHLDRIPRKYHSLIRQQIESQLRYEPDTETRNRKPLLHPSLLGSVWELRCGPQNLFRVFYRVDRARRLVYVMAVGQKIGERLFVGEEEILP